MTKVLVLYYSSFGHIEQMAYAVAEGARRAGATADVKRVPENIPAEIARTSHFKLDQPAPIATVDELANYDAIAVGAPTRFGRMPSAMGSFWEQAGRLSIKASCTARSAALSPRARPSTAATRRPSSRSSPTSCISAWSSSVCHTATRDRCTRRDRRRRALRRDHDRGRAGPTAAEPDRTRRGAISGQASPPKPPQNFRPQGVRLLQRPKIAPSAGATLSI